jgi:pimeloyl-ACP methyl ester carboxylesterase
MARTPVSLRPLATAARREGARVHFFAYSATVERVEPMASRLARRLADITATGPTLAIGHSLGGVLLRMALPRLPDDAPPPERLILIASPHRPSRIAGQLRDFLPFRLLNGDAGQMLGDASRMAAIPHPGVRCTLVLGSGGSQSGWSPFPGQENDGLVSTTEALVDGATDVVTVPALHSFIMRHPTVRQLVREAVHGLSTPAALGRGRAHRDGVAP